MVTAFVVAAWLLALGSWLFVSNATAGVAGLCFACFMAIAARIAQADKHHDELRVLLQAPARTAVKAGIAAALLLMAVPAAAQSRVYTNADLGVKVTAERPDPADAARLLAPYQFTYVAPSSAQREAQVYVMASSATAGPYGEFKPFGPFRFEGVTIEPGWPIWTGRPRWSGLSPGPRTAPPSVTPSQPWHR